MSANDTLLDNPFWSSLQTSHKAFSIGTVQIRKFPADILPFMGLAHDDASLLDQILPYCKMNEEVFLKEGIPSIPTQWKFLARLSCIQMVCTELPGIAVHNKERTEKLGPSDFDDLYEMVNLVQPGFIKKRTHLLGDYYGIRKEGRLVATAGERLKIDGFIEVSAVCTLPGHTGKGYAQQLMQIVCTGIFKKGQIPVLHVLDSNERAIRLYEMFNFRKRMDFPLVKLQMITPANEAVKL